MRILLATIITSLCAICTSCSERAVKSQEPVLVENYKKGPESRRTLKLEIEGMMCEIGCAAKIKKELLEQASVSSVIIDFDKERKTDFAIVEFDPKGNASENIYGAVSTIADGKLYTVKSVETTYYRSE
tara:strand:+ start:106 stop:492 length:387 start_codon:yes stop_codon:yes gene_type:complete